MTKIFRKIPGLSLCQIIYRELIRRDFSFSEVLNNYETYHEKSHVSPQSYLQVRLISEWIEPDSTVLSVGCGEGFAEEYLEKNKKCKVSGIDISKKAISKFITKGFEGRVRDIDKGLALTHEENYDYIIFVEVLEHLKYPHKILLEACRHAEKGVIVTLPNSGHIRWRIQMLRGYSPRQSFTHLHFWSIRDFEYS